MKTKDPGTNWSVELDMCFGRLSAACEAAQRHLSLQISNGHVFLEQAADFSNKWVRVVVNVYAAI